MNPGSPFPPWEQAAPWLAGQGAAVVLVALVAGAVVARSAAVRRRRRLGAIGWGFAATLMPGAWLVARWLPGWVAGAVEGGRDEALAAAAAGAALHGLAVWFAVYLSDLGDAAEVRPTALPTPPAARSAAPPPPASSSPAPRPSAPVAPRLAPAVGTMASGPTVRAPQADGLLRVLVDGTDMQRAAAARALALSFHDTASRPVVLGLLDVLADDDADDESRVEAWVAASRVIGEPLEWEVEAALRRDGPDGIDPAAVLAMQARVEASED